MAIFEPPKPRDFHFGLVELSGCLAGHPLRGFAFDLDIPSNVPLWPCVAWRQGWVRNPSKWRSAREARRSLKWRGIHYSPLEFTFHTPAFCNVFRWFQKKHTENYGSSFCLTFGQFGPSIFSIHAVCWVGLGCSRWRPTRTWRMMFLRERNWGKFANWISGIFDEVRWGIYTPQTNIAPGMRPF